ncbi:MAG TPA: hypothetical protein HA264_09560 [Methanolinea sp.]|jgi:uncharacterized membrane protein|nr:MAG: hypothetical protein A4E36_01636 [Methanoregulaceae archaeon PtaB.Bin009]OPY38159.1 MAG: hypothetical protein A4E41_01964 [Methanoregulaceae archaeon PtaU1.Bin066]HII77255.1 hypothetical protein [Methanolinea sp.]HNQ29994.1 hypothetical protein [Methanolinea sp.]
MDPKIINILLVVVGFFLLITGIMQVMAVPGMMDYLSIAIGVLLIITAIVGFWKGKVV